VIDRRKYAAQGHGPGQRWRTSARSWSKVTGLCLHQTACVLGERVERWDSVGSHVGITRAGQEFWLHDFDRIVAHGNGWNARTVGPARGRSGPDARERRGMLRSNPSHRREGRQSRRRREGAGVAPPVVELEAERSRLGDLAADRCTHERRARALGRRGRVQDRRWAVGAEGMGPDQARAVLTGARLSCVHDDPSLHRRRIVQALESSYGTAACGSFYATLARCGTRGGWCSWRC
jgi:hypothetical protein